MSRTIKSVFYSKLTFFNLLEAHKRACLNKGNKGEILKFNLHLEKHLINLMEEIRTDTYRVSNYSEFKVKEPKERIIRKLPYRDRIVHQWYIGEFIKPYIVKRFISDSYACIEGKGTHKGVYKLQKYMRIMKRKYGSYYVIKFDIKSFFESIDKNILFDILKRYISDKRLLSLIHKLIYENNDKKGIPIGNYTSQYFANIYLNELDYYVKHDLKIKYYIRYMDDFVMLVANKELAYNYYHKVNEFVERKLNLKLNKKSKYFPNKLGIDFLGYKIYETHILLRKRSIIKIKKKIRLYKKEYISELEMKKSLNSWYGHIKHSNSYNLKCKIDDMLDE